MTAPSVVATQTAFVTTTLSSTNIVIPAGATPGNLLVAVVGNGSSTNSTITLTGWTRLTSFESNGINIGVFWRVCDGEEPTLATSSPGSGSWTSLVVEIANADYIDGVVDAARTTVANHPAPTYTAVTETRPGYVFATIRVVDGANTLNATAAPSGYSGMVNTGQTAAAGINFAIAYATGTANNMASTTWTSPSAGAVCATFAIYTVPKITGVVRDQSGNFASRTLAVYRRSTGERPALSGGRTQGLVTSEPVGGTYSFQCPLLVEHFVVCLPDVDTLPALIADRRVPE